MSYVPVGHGYNACTSVFQLIMDLIFKLTSAAIVTRWIRVGIVVESYNHGKHSQHVVNHNPHSPRWCFQFWSLAAIQKLDVGTILKHILLAINAMYMYIGACLWNCSLSQGTRVIACDQRTSWTHICVVWYWMYFILCLIPMWILFEAMGMRLGVWLETKLEISLVPRLSSVGRAWERG